MSTVTAAELARVNAELGQRRRRSQPGRWAWVRPSSPPTSARSRPSSCTWSPACKPDVPVVWMDNGYNTEATYRFADEVTKQLGPRTRIYLRHAARAPTARRWKATPALDDPRHAAFTEEVKLRTLCPAPCARPPQVWFTALRATDSRARRWSPSASTPTASSRSAPLLHWTSKDLHEYCKAHGLPNNFDYVDPTRAKTTANAAFHRPRTDRNHERPHRHLPLSHPPTAIHLDALEEETIFILRGAAAFERPTLLFSAARIRWSCSSAPKAFGVGPHPYPLLMIDTGHNFLR